MSLFQERENNQDSFSQGKDDTELLSITQFLEKMDEKSTQSSIPLFQDFGMPTAVSDIQKQHMYSNFDLVTNIYDLFPPTPPRKDRNLSPEPETNSFSNWTGCVNPDLIDFKLKEDSRHNMKSECCLSSMRAVFVESPIQLEYSHKEETSSSSTQQRCDSKDKLAIPSSSDSEEDFLHWFVPTSNQSSDLESIANVQVIYEEISENYSQNLLPSFPQFPYSHVDYDHSCERRHHPSTSSAIQQLDVNQTMFSDVPFYERLDVSRNCSLQTQATSILIISSNDTSMNDSESFDEVNVEDEKKQVVEARPRIDKSQQLQPKTPKLKAGHFLDDEAANSPRDTIPFSSDETESLEKNDTYESSFIDDSFTSSEKSANEMMAVYLRSLHSPEKVECFDILRFGRREPTNDTVSHVSNEETSDYQLDSFCVNDDTESLKSEEKVACSPSQGNGKESKLKNKESAEPYYRPTKRRRHFRKRIIVFEESSSDEVY